SPPRIRQATPPAAAGPRALTPEVVRGPRTRVFSAPEPEGDWPILPGPARPSSGKKFGRARDTSAAKRDRGGNGPPAWPATIKTPANEETTHVPTDANEPSEPDQQRPESGALAPVSRRPQPRQGAAPRPAGDRIPRRACRAGRPSP